MEHTKKSSKRVVFYVVSALVFILFLGLDQWSKSAAVRYLKDQKPIAFCDDAFELYYLENHGAAWGILSGKTALLIAITVMILMLLIYFYSRIPYNRSLLLLCISLLLICSGAVGNMIDRILHNYVIDYIYIKCIEFPVFNVADIYVTVGAFLFAICLLFVYSEEDLAFWKFKK